MIKPKLDLNPKESAADHLAVCNNRSAANGKTDSIERLPVLLRQTDTEPNGRGGFHSF